MTRKGGLPAAVGAALCALAVHAEMKCVAHDGTETGLAEACKPGQKRQDLDKEREATQRREAAAQQLVPLKLSPPEALARSIRHLLKTKPLAYKRGREYLKQAETFVTRMPDLIERVEKLDPAAADEIIEYGKLCKQALVLDNPYIDFEEIVAVVSDKVAVKSNWVGSHTMAPKGYKNKLVRYNLRTGEMRDIYAPPDDAYVGEPDLHFDGQKLLFTSTDKNGTFQIMEVNLADGQVRQVSTIAGAHIHNYGGIYLPNENIVFSSTAPMVGVPCIGGSCAVPNLYLMGPDGGNPRQLTFEQDADWYPTVREDGQIMYLRWEYTDIMHYYSRIMMTMNPDGTNQRAIYGSQSLWPNTMFYARPIPDAPGQFVAVVTGHHGVPSAGKLTIFDTNKGFVHADGVVQHIPGYGKKVTHVTVDQLYPKVKPALLEQFPNLQADVDSLIRQHMPEASRPGKDFHDLDNDFFNMCYHRLRAIYPEMALDLDRLVDGVYPQFLQPYPVSANYYLAVVRLKDSETWQLCLVDTFDNFVPLQPPQPDGYKYMLEPYPLRKRTRPPVIPDKVNLQDRQGVCYVQNVYRGPGLKDVPVGTVDALRVFTYAYCYYQTGSHDHIGVESGWDVKRLLGTVKVEKDGSAMFNIPANTTISLQPLDKEGRAIQLFRSWLVAMPGEKLSCIGCHEPPTEPPVSSKTIASGKPPQAITPWRERLEGFAFEAEIQPILDAYCVRCHDGSDVKRVSFKGVTPDNPVRSRYSAAYHAFHRYFRRPGPESSGLMFKPYEYHASTSEGVQLIEKGHYGVKLDGESWRRLYAWVDLNVPYFGSWSTAYASNAGRHNWTTNMAAYAASLRANYANVHADWEAVSGKPYPVAVPREKGEERKPPVAVTASGWPFSPEVARQKQQAAGETRRVVDLGNGLQLAFVRIPAGEFVMGSDDETPWEQPRHRVKIERDFWMSEVEVNNAAFFTFKPDHNAGVFDQQWKDHVRNGYYANYAEQPAVRVTWHDAAAFCDWVGKKTGAKVMLPTEAQWEWACRAGSNKAMWFGGTADDFSPFANLADKSFQRCAVSGVNPTFSPNLVGNPHFDFVPRVAEFDDKQFLVTGTKQYQANAWGLYDMHGNVAEWTRSDYVRYPYKADQAESNSAEVRKAVRGGSFHDRPYRATASYRLGYAPWQGVFNVGFRVVIE